MGKIIQFKYGDDNFDPIKVESQTLGFMDMTYEEIYSYYQLPSLDKDKAILQIFTKSVQKTLKTQKKEMDIKNKFYIMDRTYFIFFFSSLLKLCKYFLITYFKVKVLAISQSNKII